MASTHRQLSREARLRSASAASDLPEALRRQLLRPTWVEVDLDAIEHNVKTVKRWLNGVKLIGVLKGDACGFGTAECGLAMEAAGVEMLAVGNPFEVKVLRSRGVKCPILLYASFAPESVREIVALGAIPSIVDRGSMETLAQAARSLSNPLEVFIKIDTGLGRLGVPYVDAPALIEAATRTPSLRVVGLYSHAGGVSAERAVEQLQRVTQVLARTDKLGIKVAFKVLASTPHMMQFPEMRLTAVDPGRLLFGIKQPPDAPCPEGNLLPALRALRTRLIQVKAVTAGDPPEYGWGRTHGAKRYGILPFGWTDGLLSEAYERSGVLVRGVPARFLAPLSAEHSVIDVTDVPDAQTGDTVTILGRDGASCIEVERVAQAAGVQVSDVTRRFHRHLPFVYFWRGTPARLKTPLGEVAAPF
ncbi:MAG TPA: alanine racemase [Casimicrobiaceae bacterium]|jgi:alanine racemase|nr:alanine racemase [Casimicrobiaceae bacterium]